MSGSSKIISDAHSTSNVKFTHHFYGNSIYNLLCMKAARVDQARFLRGGNKTIFFKEDFLKQ